MERKWIQHDGKRCPVERGTLVETIDHYPRTGQTRVREPFAALAQGNGESWTWGQRVLDPRQRDGFAHIVAYRRAHDPQADADHANARQAYFHSLLRAADVIVKPQKVKPYV